MISCQLKNIVQNCLYKQLSFITLVVGFSMFILLLSCTQPIKLNNMITNSGGYFEYGKNGSRSFYENVIILDSLKYLWTVETHASQTSTTLTIFDDLLFVTDLSGRLYVFDRKTGKSFGYEKFDGAIEISPVIIKHRIYLLINNQSENYSTLVIYNFVMGKIVNEKIINSRVTNEMLRFEDGVIITTDDGEIIKYDFMGEIEWNIKAGSPILSSPVHDVKNLYCANINGEIIKYELDNQNIVWRKKVGDAIESNLTIAESALICGDISGRLCSVNKVSGNINWVANINSKIINTPVFDENNIYTGNLAGHFFAIEKQSGKVIYRFNTEGLINATPLILNNTILLPDFNKKMWLLNKSDGSVIQQINYDRRVKLSPLYYDNIFYTGSDRGLVHAYKVN